MAFKLATERRFKTKILIRMPNEKGTHSQIDFFAIFKSLKVSDINALRAAGEDLELLKQVFVGFENVENEDGSPAEFTEEARDRLLDEPLVLAALSQAYLAEAINGTGRQKN
ncbi:MAG: hypothetical protein IPK59_04085 [Rhodospirillaceae bacterium]|nr:hypothetical protein [Rhodospirillaceae bacterium]